MSLTFTIKGNHKRYTQEYKEQKLNGKIVRLTSYENKTSDVHEHILRNIPSFADFIDRELHDRISSAEKSQMKISDFTSKLGEPVIIEFKSFNFAIIKVKTVRRWTF